MSVESITLALHHSRAVGTDKVVLIGIANHDGDGGAWPSIATLAKYANVKPRTVQRSIANLVELGEVEVVLNGGGLRFDADHTRPNLYRLALRCPANCDGTTAHRLTTDPLTPASPPDAHVTPSPDAHVTTPLTPTSPKPSFNRPENRPPRSRSTRSGSTAPVEHRKGEGFEAQKNQWGPVVDHVLTIRTDWTARQVLDVLTDPAIAARPIAVVTEALLIVAEDRAGTRYPGRLRLDLPHWAEAERRVERSNRPDHCGGCDVNRMIEVDDHRVMRCPICHPHSVKVRA